MNEDRCFGARSYRLYLWRPLSEAGANATLLARREEYVKRVRRHGLRITGVIGNRSIRIKATTDNRVVKDAELVLLTVKSYDSANALERIKDMVPNRASILTIQNGIGNIERIANQFSIRQALGGVTTLASKKVRDGEINHVSWGDITIGTLDGSIT